MNGYSQKFTLLDIFNNPKLKGKLPLVRYKEKPTEKGTISIRTNMQTLGSLVYETAKKSARPFYNPLNASKNGDTIFIGGKLIGDIDSAVDSIYLALLGKRFIMNYTVNNADMIRTALKESEKQKYSGGRTPKLWLKVGSMLELEQMSNTKLSKVMDDIMKNIFYNDDFAQTQKKYNVKDIPIGVRFNYEQRKKRWDRKVGEQ